MADILTEASLPGVFGSGLAERGRLSRAEMIVKLREFAAHNKEVAEKVLAASDADFNVRVVKGQHRRTIIERLT